MFLAIVTSRRRLDSAAHAIRLDKLELEAADELLTELGQRWEPVARLTTAERDQLYAETGGNPLLLTWTAGQLGRTTGRCRTVAEAVERLQECIGSSRSVNKTIRSTSSLATCWRPSRRTRRRCWPPWSTSRGQQNWNGFSP